MKILSSLFIKRCKENCEDPFIIFIQNHKQNGRDPSATLAKQYNENGKDHVTFGHVVVPTLFANNLEQQ